MSDTKSTQWDGVIRRECYSLNPELIDGKVLCSTWVSFDEFNPEDIVSDQFEAIEVRFPLAEVVNDVIVGNRYGDGTVALEAKEKLLAIRAELAQMIIKIDAVSYSEK